MLARVLRFWPWPRRHLRTQPPSQPATHPAAAAHSQRIKIPACADIYHYSCRSRSTRTSSTRTVQLATTCIRIVLALLAVEDSRGGWGHGWYALGSSCLRTASACLAAGYWLLAGWLATGWLAGSWMALACGSARQPASRVCSRPGYGWWPGTARLAATSSQPPATSNQQPTQLIPTRRPTSTSMHAASGDTATLLGLLELEISLHISCTACTACAAPIDHAPTQQPASQSEEARCRSHPTNNLTSPTCHRRYHNPLRLPISLALPCSATVGCTRAFTCRCWQTPRLIETVDHHNQQAAANYRPALPEHIMEGSEHKNKRSRSPSLPASNHRPWPVLQSWASEQPWTAGVLTFILAELLWIATLVHNNNVQ